MEKEEENFIGKMFITACQPARMATIEIRHHADFLNSQNKKKKINARRR